MFRPMRQAPPAALSVGLRRHPVPGGPPASWPWPATAATPMRSPSAMCIRQGTLFFHCAKAGHKLDALRRCSKASFCVIDQDQVVPPEYTTYFRSVIAFGRTRILEDKAEKQAAIWLLAEKYCPGDSPEHRQEAIRREAGGLCLVSLSIEHMTGQCRPSSWFQEDRRQADLPFVTPASPFCVLGLNFSFFPPCPLRGR